MAQCQACRGTGKDVQAYLMLPTFQVRMVWSGEAPYPHCRECNGSGIENCCEGLREQFAADTASRKEWAKVVQSLDLTCRASRKG